MGGRDTTEQADFASFAPAASEPSAEESYSDDEEGPQDEQEDREKGQYGEPAGVDADLLVCPWGCRSDSSTFRRVPSGISCPECSAIVTPWVRRALEARENAE
jgi:hypothetical protein